MKPERVVARYDHMRIDKNMARFTNMSKLAVRAYLALSRAAGTKRLSLAEQAMLPPHKPQDYELSEITSALECALAVAHRKDGGA
ncbi:MAG: hypothetical protein KGL39_09120 [Patescibacteria group bacterium]|nr:hypothetical protein [Patescibacteria group bacterium]